MSPPDLPKPAHLSGAQQGAQKGREPRRIKLGKPKRQGNAAKNCSCDRHPEQPKQAGKFRRRMRRFSPAGIQANGASNDSGGESNSHSEQARLYSQIRAFLQTFAQNEILRRKRRGDQIVHKSDRAPNRASDDNKTIFAKLHRPPAVPIKIHQGNNQHQAKQQGDSIRK